MFFAKYYFLFFGLLALECYALNCRTDGGPKESELKKIYTKCLKMQENKMSNNSRSNDQAWNKPQRHNQKRDRERDRSGNDDRRRNRNDEMGNNDGRMGNNDGRMGYNDGRMGKNDGRMGYNENRMGSDRMSGRTSNRNDMSNRDGRDHFNSRNDFMGDEFGEMSEYGGYQPSTASPRRYKRERRIENSGHRSQFNPISQKSDYDDSKDEKSNENNTKGEMDTKACAMHCFLENLEMNGEDGMPDRYMVSHAITKEVKNADLKDFLQESVEECFQILDNENTEDKCEFSKNLLMCLSEKGRANCDDWKDDLQL